MHKDSIVNNHCSKLALSSINVQCLLCTKHCTMFVDLNSDCTSMEGISQADEGHYSVYAGRTVCTVAYLSVLTTTFIFICSVMDLTSKVLDSRPRYSIAAVWQKSTIQCFSIEYDSFCNTMIILYPCLNPTTFN